MIEKFLRDGIKDEMYFLFYNHIRGGHGNIIPMDNQLQCDKNVLNFDVKTSGMFWNWLKWWDDWF